MESIEIQEVEYNSDWQKKSIDLRYSVLREPLGLTYTAQQLEEEKDEIHIIARVNDKIIGVLLLKIIDDKTLKMRQVAVDVNWQNKGIGRQLVEYGESYARKNKYAIIELHARDTAKNFYIKMQYRIIGDIFEEVGIPHFKMIKELE